MDIHLYSPSKTPKFHSTALNDWFYLVIIFLAGVRPIKFKCPKNQEINNLKNNLRFVATYPKYNTDNYLEYFKFMIIMKTWYHAKLFWVLLSGSLPIGRNIDSWNSSLRLADTDLPISWDGNKRRVLSLRGHRVLVILYFK